MPVPMMFRAQVEGRCQLQYAGSDDKETWLNEWKNSATTNTTKVPKWSEEVETRKYQIAWRFVTNGGQDDGITRPVITTTGLPFYPGSSMKGAFLRACKKSYLDKVELYCGSKDQPGILRFHGGYPTNDWKNQLLDIVHPQQGWQVGTQRNRRKPEGESAFTLISLYQPILEFGISTNNESLTNWKEVWEIWEKALASGLGCRTSSGYGAISFCCMDDNGEKPSVALAGEILFRGKLKGQGQASKLLDRTSEFRPNIFRAAIRGHALRIFGGITNKEAANKIVNDLFGSTDGKGNVGKLAMNFQQSSLIPGNFGHHQQPTYDVEGELIWSATRELPTQQIDTLEKLITELNRFAMLMGGFGNSWRRADHRKFYKEKDRNGNDYSKLVGCHWEWTDKELLKLDLNTNLWADEELLKLDFKTTFKDDIKLVGTFIDQLIRTAKAWINIVRVNSELNLENIDDGDTAPWREAWQPEKVEVWGRIAKSTATTTNNDILIWKRPPAREDHSEAIAWLHRDTHPSIKRTPITGYVGKEISPNKKETRVGKLWHRMYPLIKININTHEIDKSAYEKTPCYLELLTVFTDNSTQSNGFLGFLDNESSFDKLWPVDKSDEPRNH